MKFIHAADIHLDSPLVGLQRYEGAPVEEIRGATRRAFQNLVDLAISEAVDFVLIAGDLYDGDWKDYNTGLFLAAQMGKLRGAGIRVFIIAGNHDALSQITKTLRMPENVRWLSAQKPESVVLEDLGVAIHGRGFSSRVVTEDLTHTYPNQIKSLFNIGLLHTSADGREGHEVYAPCSLPGLLSKNYDYWALGHVHKHEVLHREPWILFPGNIQGRHSRETGAKGCALVTVEAGRVLAVQHQELDVLRWVLCHVNATDAKDMDEVLNRAGKALKQELEGCGGRPLAVRFQINGPTRAHGELSANPEYWTQQLRSLATDLGQGSIWVEKIKIRTQDMNSLENMIRKDDAIGGLLKAVDNLNLDEELLADFRNEFSDLMRKLPFELKGGEEPMNLENTGTFREILQDVKQLMLARILSEGDR